MNQSDVLLNSLKQAGHRITAQRRIVCDHLAASRNHPTAYQVYAELSSEHPEISRATVYNTLNVLKSLGAIVEMNYGDEHTHYETDLSPHINLICLRCRKIVDYFGPPHLEEVGDAVLPESGFQPVATKVEVYGFCAECRERKKSEIREQWLEQHHLVQEDEQ